MKIEWLPPCSDPYGDWPEERIEEEPEYLDSSTHHEQCGCEGCIDHFGRQMVRESEGGWGE